LWEYNAGSPISGSPTLTRDENIIIGCDNGKLLALSFNGELKWYLQTNAALNAPPLITSNGLILIGGNDSKIYILKNPTLSLLENSSNVALEWPTFKGNNKRTGNKVETLTSVITEDEDIPKSYSLLQNFPNPFNPSTKIFYALPNTGTVQIKVFDLLGQEIVTLVNETKAAGNYQIDFNASSLPSGIYLYRINAGSFVQTKKMILLK
jgi:outer membrane protein assembly factor BamB